MYISNKIIAFNINRMPFTCHPQVASQNVVFTVFHSQMNRAVYLGPSHSSKKAEEKLNNPYSKHLGWVLTLNSLLHVHTLVQFKFLAQAVQPEMEKRINTDVCQDIRLEKTKVYHFAAGVKVSESMNFLCLQLSWIWYHYNHNYIKHGFLRCCYEPRNLGWIKGTLAVGTL